MRILLLGEYSNVHATLAEGLRTLGHQVTVASNGDFWKNYPRDIDLSRKDGKLGGLKLLAKVYAQLPQWRGYDVVQLINPMFLELRAERILPIYKYLRKHNKKMVLCAMGMDYYWVHECTYNKPLRYSDFNIGDQIRTDEPAIREQRDWLGTAKERLNKFIAADCDQIIAGLYEDFVCYKPYFKEKTSYVPLPLKMLANPSPLSPVAKLPNCSLLAIASHSSPRNEWMQNPRPVATQFRADPKPRQVAPRRPEPQVEPFSASFKRQLDIASGGRFKPVRSSSPAVSSTPSSSVSGLREGVVIEHQRFGIGTVVKLEGTGDNEKATVEFRNVGTKQLLLKFAKFNIVK